MTYWRITSAECIGKLNKIKTFTIYFFVFLSPPRTGKSENKYLTIANTLSKAYRVCKKTGTTID